MQFLMIEIQMHPLQVEINSQRSQPALLISTHVARTNFKVCRAIPAIPFILAIAAIPPIYTSDPIQPG